jgi:hypothetical protein
LRTPLDELSVSKLVMAVGFDDHASSCTPSSPPWWVTRAWPRAAHHPFPDYDGLWPEFATDLDDMAMTCVERGRQAPVVSECTLSYVNPVTAVEPWPRNRRLERLLLHWFGDGFADGLLPTPDDVVADAHFSLPRRGAAPPGTMTIEMHWLSVEGPEHLVATTLSARSVVPDGELGSVRAFFDHALDWIIRGFAAVSDAAAIGAPEPGVTPRVP